MNRLKNIFTIICLLAPALLYAQKEMIIEEISRTTKYMEEGMACFEIVSTDGDIVPRSIMEEFIKTRLPDGTYSYKAIMDTESGTKRTFYIAAPLVMEQQYRITGIQTNEYISIRVTIPKNELAITPKDNLTPSESSNAIYQFLANIPDIQITTDNGLEFTNKGKNEASFYVYELTVPIAGTTGLNVSIRAIGYEELAYKITDVNNRVFGFFIFPKEECFGKNFELGNEYFRDGSYKDAIRYYQEAQKCDDRDTGAPLDEKLKGAETFSRIRDLIDKFDNRANVLNNVQRNDLSFKDGVDSVHWYKSRVIELMRELLKKNPSDKFCASDEIAKREEALQNSSRIICGTATDLEFQNQYLANVVIYGSEDKNADKGKMMMLGRTDNKGEFTVKVSNRYVVLYFEHIDKNYKPARIDITNGRRYKYRVELQRKVSTVGVF